MINLSKVVKNPKQYAKIALVLLTLVTAISCCPKEGVDKSFQDNSFNVTLDVYSQNAQQKIEYLDHDSRLSVIMNNGARMTSQNFSQDSSVKNRFTFYFDSSIQDEDISSLEVKLIDYQDQNLNYQTIIKTLHQRPPTLIAQSKWDGFFCNLNPIDWILPQAHALSCKPKEGSTISWRAGYLIQLILIPKI